MIIKKFNALFVSLKGRILGKRPLLSGQETTVSSQERGLVFAPSSTYAEYVASVVQSDRAHPDSHYSFRS